MAKFNWDRFYDEIENNDGDPKKFPFWLWMYEEMFQILREVVIGIVVGGFVIIVIMVTIGAAWHKATTTNFAAQEFCAGYNTP